VRRSNGAEARGNGAFLRICGTQGLKARAKRRVERIRPESANADTGIRNPAAVVPSRIFFTQGTGIGKTHQDRARAAADEAGETLVTIVAQQAGAKVDPSATWQGLGRNRRLKLGRMGLTVGSLAPSAIGPEGEDR
jgi:hypothetical protein